MDHRPTEELLESIHAFPGTFRIKAIGAADQDFAGRVVAAVLEEVVGPSELDYSVRSTPGGRHEAVSLDVTVQTAEQVRAIYARIKQVEGLTLLL